MEEANQTVRPQTVATEVATFAGCTAVWEPAAGHICIATRPSAESGKHDQQVCFLSTEQAAALLTSGAILL